MSTRNLSRPRELAHSITVDPDRLAELYRQANLGYESMLEKLEVQAGWIADKMTRLRESIARNRDRRGLAADHDRPHHDARDVLIDDEPQPADAR